MQTESEIQKKIVAYLKGKNFLVFRMNSGYIRKNVKLSPPGTPDLLVICDDSFVLWIEVKAEGKSTSIVQDEMHAKLKDKGQYVLVAYSVEDVKDILNNS